MKQSTGPLVLLENQADFVAIDRGSRLIHGGHATKEVRVSIQLSDSDFPGSHCWAYFSTSQHLTSNGTGPVLCSTKEFLPDSIQGVVRMG